MVMSVEQVQYSTAQYSSVCTVLYEGKDSHLLIGVVVV